MFFVPRTDIGPLCSHNSSGRHNDSLVPCHSHSGDNEPKIILVYKLTRKLRGICPTSTTHHMNSTDLRLDVMD